QPPMPRCAPPMRSCTSAIGAAGTSSPTPGRIGTRRRRPVVRHPASASSGILPSGGRAVATWPPLTEVVMTLDEYVAWASRHAGGREDRALLEVGLGFAAEIGEVAGALARWLRGDESRPDRLADALGRVAYCWARLCAVTGIAPAILLARSRA